MCEMGISHDVFTASDTKRECQEVMDNAVHCDAFNKEGRVNVFVPEEDADGFCASKSTTNFAESISDLATSLPDLRSEGTWVPVPQDDEQEGSSCSRDSNSKVFHVMELCSDVMCVFGSGYSNPEPHENDLPHDRAKRQDAEDSNREPHEKEVHQGHEDSNGEPHEVEHRECAKEEKEVSNQEPKDEVRQASFGDADLNHKGQGGKDEPQGNEDSNGEPHHEVMQQVQREHCDGEAGELNIKPCTDAKEFLQGYADSNCMHCAMQKVMVQPIGNKDVIEESNPRPSGHVCKVCMPIM